MKRGHVDEPNASTRLYWDVQFYWIYFLMRWSGSIEYVFPFADHFFQMKHLWTLDTKSADMFLYFWNKLIIPIDCSLGSADYKADIINFM